MTVQGKDSAAEDVPTALHAALPITASSSASGDPGERLFCIGDIHGCHDRLAALMKMLPLDRERDRLVFLGDYINRGPDTPKTLDLLLEIEASFRNTIFLKGNHEQVLLDYADSGDVALVPVLRQMGTEETIDRYGARLNAARELGCFPAEHQQFLRSLQYGYCWHSAASTRSRYICTHADITDELIAATLQTGICPTPEPTEEAILLCGRRFLERQAANADVTVVFGHTPLLSPLVQPHQICIDTGAVYGNLLTAVELPARRFYHA